MAKAKKTRAIKMTTHESTLESLISDAFSIFEELGSELGEWRDNLEEKFSQTSKYEMVSEAANAMEELQAPDIAEWLSTETHKITWQEPARKKKSSRAARRDDAASCLDRAIQYLDGIEENEKDYTEDQRAEAKELRDLIEEAKDNTDGVEFPGMCG